MKLRSRQRRFILFIAAFMVLAGGLTTSVVMSLKKRLAADEWTDYLGANEMASLNSALSGDSEDPSLDANLKITGLYIEPGQLMTTVNSSTILYEARIDPRVAHLSPLDVVQDAWTQRGLKLSRADNQVTAKAPNGDTYVASTSEGHPGMVLLSHYLSAGSRQASATDWPVQYAGIFPPIPGAMRMREQGRPGAPGYSVMMKAPESPVLTFKVFRAELEKRGWEPLNDELDKAFREASDRKLESLAMLAVTYRHRNAPFGCQLVVTDNTDEFNSSHVLLSLF